MSFSVEVFESGYEKTYSFRVKNARQVLLFIGPNERNCASYNFVGFQDGGVIVEEVLFGGEIASLRRFGLRRLPMPPRIIMRDYDGVELIQPEITSTTAYGRMTAVTDYDPYLERIKKFIKRK